MVLPEGNALLDSFYQTHQKYRVQYEDIQKSGVISQTSLSHVHRASFVHNNIRYDIASKELRICSDLDNPNIYKVFPR